MVFVLFCHQLLDSKTTLVPSQPFPCRRPIVVLSALCFCVKNKTDSDSDQLDNDHVKGNFILFAMTIESL